MYNFNLGSTQLPDILDPYFRQQDMYSRASSGYHFDGLTGAGSYGRFSPPFQLRRRYSIGGLPTPNELYNYSTAEKLLNEASKSISRSSQILNLHWLSQFPHLNLNSSQTQLNDNLLQMAANFSSQPNISFSYDTKPQPGRMTSTQQNLAPHLKPSLSSSHLNYLYQKPTGVYGGASYVGYNPCAGASAAPHIFSQTPSHNLLQQRSILPSLYASNPALSHDHHHPQLYHPSSYQYHPQFHQPSQPVLSSSHKYHPHHSQYPHTSEYSNRYFDHQPHHHDLLSSKRDLDYLKQPEIKRQVSFKFDVDTLSIDS